MKILTVVAALSLFPCGLFAQAPAGIECRPMSGSGNTFISAGETVINGQVCRAAPAPIAVVAVPPKPAGPPRMEVLPDGTPIALRFTEEVSSADASKGDRISFEVVEDVALDGHVVIPKGAVAMGTVLKAHRKARMGRAGKLAIALEYVTAAGGEKIPLRGAKVAKGDNSAASITAGVVVTSLVFLPAAPLFLMKQGHTVSIDAGTPANAFVDGDVRVNVNAGVFVAAKL
ncbi:MAG: hypothetical protein ACRD33_02770 [Candidatus Acidiferrales bacterium]